MHNLYKNVKLIFSTLSYFLMLSRQVEIYLGLSICRQAYIQTCMYVLLHVYKHLLGTFTNTCKGPDAKKKKIIAKIFLAPFLLCKQIWGQPIEKACKLNCYQKICSNFSRLPSHGSKILRVPLFASGPSPTSVCKWSLIMLVVLLSKLLQQ